MPKVAQLRKNKAGVQIQVFGFHVQTQVQILGSFQCSTVWGMLIDFEMPLDHSCGWIQQPPVNRNLETGREVISGKIDPESPAEVVVEANLANELLLERMETKKGKQLEKTYCMYTRDQGSKRKEPEK